jgi:MarR family transcriptional regulator, transcriptional regulator for hemolysin
MPASITQSSEALALVDVARLIREDFKKRAKHTGLSQAQWRILLCLHRSPGITPSALAVILEVSPVTVSQSIDRLVKAGWVTKEPDPADGRGLNLHLTAQGAPVVDELNDIALKLHRDLFDGFEPGEMAQLSLLLNKLRRNLCVAAESF